MQWHAPILYDALSIIKLYYVTLQFYHNFHSYSLNSTKLFCSLMRKKPLKRFKLFSEYFDENLICFEILKIMKTPCLQLFVHISYIFKRVKTQWNRRYQQGMSETVCFVANNRKRHERNGKYSRKVIFINIFSECLNCRLKKILFFEHVCRT